MQPKHAFNAWLDSQHIESRHDGYVQRGVGTRRQLQTDAEKHYCGWKQNRSLAERAKPTVSLRRSQSIKRRGGRPDLCRVLSAQNRTFSISATRCTSANIVHTPKCDRALSCSVQQWGRRKDMPTHDAV